MKQYLDIARRIVDEGTWIENPRTKVRCKTIICADVEFSGNDPCPVVTTRKAPFKLPVAELLGYIRGLDDASEFAKLGTKSWLANANKNKAWLANPNRKCEDDMGRVYGVQGRRWRCPDGSELDQFKRVYEDIRAGVDNRGEIVTYWNPGEENMMCLRPCMYEYQFSLLGRDLYLNITQRSADLPLGSVANFIQAYVLLKLMAQITGKNPKKVFLRMINTHIYQTQYDLMCEQLKRTPLKQPDLWINPEIRTLKDVETWVTTDDFKLLGYEHHPAIKYPFTV